MRAKKKIEEPKAEQPEQPALRLEWRTPQELAENPRNWKNHPESQTRALTSIMSEVGWAGALLWNAATGRLIDGHARRKLALEQGSEKVPVLVGSWTEAQERIILASLDPIGAMAEQDDAALQALIDEVSQETPEMKALLDEILGGGGQGAPEQEPEDETYSNKIIAPIYTPKGERPPVSALLDHGKTDELLAAIDAAGLPDDVAQFLRLAAERHTVFNFRQIAEFYCHADKTVQDLMEKSGLVIIDFDKAIENGFVHLTERLGALADQEEADAA